MSSATSVISKGSNLNGQSQASASSSSSSQPADFSQALDAGRHTNDPLVAHLGLNEIHEMSKITRSWHAFFEKDETKDERTPLQ